MNKSQIMHLAHQQRRERGITLSLAQRQVYAALRAGGMQQIARGVVVTHTVDLGLWLIAMAAKGPAVLAAYSIPAV